MRILITTAETPFIEGGGELHARRLRQVLRDHGHQVELFAFPMVKQLPRQIESEIDYCQQLHVETLGGEKIDRVIGLKFPSYLIPHHSKVIWLLHQYRFVYELWDHPTNHLRNEEGAERAKTLVRDADVDCFEKIRNLFSTSHNVAGRLKNFCGIESAVLYHPPPEAEMIYSAQAQDYFYFPSRLNPRKRHVLAIEALQYTKQPVKLKFSWLGASHPLKGLQERAQALGVADRVEWMGPLSPKVKCETLAHARAVVYPTYDEDYGYVTLEAMLAAKPVVTCSDSGGPLEFISDYETGLVCEPEPRALAAAMDELWADRKLAGMLGSNARERYHLLPINWENVVASLLR